MNHHYHRNRMRDEQRLRTLRAVTKAAVGTTPIGFLAAMEARERAVRILGSLTWAQQMEYYLYHSYKRQYLN